ncbi:SDR family oxidoreductase [Mycolicibacterium komossense]|uniref:SDR family oxidoreductase n=1 Tax=Mycolicibacterium komossense TaxID=1779 RepID=A0ABT3C755_9MYCO|nr:SDR family oxidoreductase [Mycolicibacterium komossense]
MHIVTGATGFVGSHLLADLLSDPDTAEVYALCRPTEELSARQRLLDAIAGANRDLPVGAVERLVVLEADVTRPLCGVSPERITRGGDSCVFWHLGASLQWRKGRRDETFDTNVAGTRHALELADRAAADLFVYVSTAYTCGSLGGDIPEALHRPASFNNAYEESKCAAEHLVAGFGGPRSLILRPSIIVGSSTDYSASGSYTGLYGYISELRRFNEMIGDSTDTVRLSTNRDTRLSFIAVDHVVQDMRSIVLAELKAPQQTVYHVTGESECYVGEILDYMLKLFGLQDRILTDAETIQDPTPLERFFEKRVEFFVQYTRTEKRFVRSTSPGRSVLINELAKYIDAEVIL